MGQILARFSVEFINSMVDVLAITYDYEEALVRQNFKQENVDQLRYAIEKSDTCIPKCLHDKLVLFKHDICKCCDFFLNNQNSSNVHSCCNFCVLIMILMNALSYSQDTIHSEKRHHNFVQTLMLNHRK